MEVSHPNNHALTCITCKIVLNTQPQHRQHYLSQLHRYNIKRKMVKLQPVTLQQFQAKKMEERQAAQPSQYKCNQCNKQFSSHNTFKQHIESKKHNPNLTKIITTPKPQYKYTPNDKCCLFCHHCSDDVSASLKHMYRQHAFFISQEKYCKDVSGLILYLQEKLQVGLMCIQCDNAKSKDFTTGNAVRNHMSDKGHFYMKTDNGYEEYEKYYDFSEKFKEKLGEQNKKVPGIEYEEVEVIADGEASDEEEWEDQSNGDDQSFNGQIQQKTNLYRIMRPTLTNNQQLLLPNGKILGNRKYRFLYKQYCRTYFRQTQLKAIFNGQSKSNSLVASNTMVGNIKIFKEMFRIEKRKYLKTGITNNNMKHYRDRNAMC